MPKVAALDIACYPNKRWTTQRSHETDSDVDNENPTSHNDSPNGFQPETASGSSHLIVKPLSQPPSTPPEDQVVELSPPVPVIVTIPQLTSQFMRPLWPRRQFMVPPQLRSQLMMTFWPVPLLLEPPPSCTPRVVELPPMPLLQVSAGPAPDRKASPAPEPEKDKEKPSPSSQVAESAQRDTNGNTPQETDAPSAFTKTR
jgi:hypothetical protein